MNYYSAREIKSNGVGTGKYHYTCQNDGYIYAIGNCSILGKCDKCDGQMRKGPCEVGPYLCETCKDTGVMLLAKEKQCPGHDTPEEACKHYKDYLLENVRFSELDEWPKNKCDCEDCNEIATVGCMIPGGYQYFSFCSLHANRQELEKVFDVGECWCS